MYIDEKLTMEISPESAGYAKALPLDNLPSKGYLPSNTLESGLE